MRPTLLQKLTTYAISVQVDNFLRSSTTKTLSLTPTGCLQLNATFSADLTALDLQFFDDDYTLVNSLYNTPSAAAYSLCAYLFAQQTLSKMGAAPLCQ